MLQETPNAEPTTNDADEPSQVLVHDGLPRSEPVHNSVDQDQFQSPALPHRHENSPPLCHENSQTPSRGTPSLFLPPHPPEQSENTGFGNPLGPSNIPSVIKPELDDLDMPYLEIGNLQPGSSKRESPAPPISSTPPRSPTRPSFSDEELLSRSHPIPTTRVLPHASPVAQTSSDAFPPPRVPNSPILPLQQISQNVLPTPSVPVATMPPPRVPNDPILPPQQVPKAVLPPSVPVATSSQANTEKAGIITKSRHGMHATTTAAKLQECRLVPQNANCKHTSISSPNIENATSLTEITKCFHATVAPTSYRSGYVP
ncbi:hypothetical protein IFR05_009990 [Cadophora sp. M221]|nr:hypothetical protein IFR05_009990 [Cadophora sp. M221]